ncbi:MAG TPA: cytochrome P450 [Acidimicrobiales bacterium]|nr:cytochrome P450 [Acidimicrobiales bacterium]
MEAANEGYAPTATTVTQLASADDPREISRMLREQPVHRIGDMFTLVTRRSDVEDALRKAQVFSWGAVGMNLGNVRPLIPLQIDPPMHVKYRRILDPLFAPKKMALLEDEIVALVKELVDAFIDKGTVDFHEAFAVPLPCRVFLRLMGLPLEDLDFFLSLKDDIIRPPGITLEEQNPHREAAGAKVYEYFEKELAKRKAHPTDDLLAQIIAGEVDGEKLTDEEVMDICYLFIIAGLDTVTDSLDCFFAYLAQNPEHRRQVVGDESIIPSAVEELLRWETPVPAVPRCATEDVEVSGCPIKAGEQVMILISSANTDDTAHPGVDEVDLTRNPNPHLAFGGGVHRCLGSHLARVELRVALREFHRRIPEYWLPEGTVLEYTPGLRSLHHLPLAWPVAR